MSARLCLLCNELISLDDNFKIVLSQEHRTVIIDKTSGRSHVLMSKRATTLMLRRQQRKAEPQTWVINPKQSPVAEAPIPVEETVSTAPGPENNMEIKKRERESKKQAKREAKLLRRAERKRQQELEAASDSTSLEQEPVSLEKMPANA